MTASGDRRGWTLLLLGLAGLAVVLTPLAGRTWSTDIWGETRHLQAAEAFAREGFVAHRFTPYTQLSAPDETPPAFRVYYTRTQQLSFVWFGWLHGLGVHSVVAWRLFAIGMTMAGLVAFWAMLRAGGVPRPAAGWSTLVLASVPAIGYWGTTWALIYCSMPLLTFGAMALWLRRRRGPTRPWIPLLLWLALFLQALATQHTYLMTTQLFFWIYALMERRWSWRGAALWLSPHVAGLAVIVLKNAWLLGGLGPALFDDILPKVLWRTANVSTAGAANASYPFDWGHLGGMLWKHFRWSGGLMALALWGLVAILRAPGHGARLTAETRRLLVALLVPGILYWFVFFQEVYVHYFHARNLMAASCLLAGFAAWRLTAGAGRRRAWIAVALVTLALAAQFRYTQRQAGERLEWTDEVDRLGDRLSSETDLVICCERDDYPAHYLLDRPFVFPRPVNQKISTHPWWRLDDWEDAREVIETVRALWPGRRVGFAVRLHPDSEPLRRELRSRLGPPRFAGETHDVFVVDLDASVDVAESAEPVE